MISNIKQTSFIIIYLIIISVICIGAFIYNQVLQDNFSESTCLSLQEVLNQQKLSFQFKLEGEINSLKILSRELTDRYTDFNDLSKCVSAIDAAKQNTDFGFITLANLDGLGIANNGRQVDVGYQKYFQKAALGETFISDPFAPPFDEGLLVAVATPVYSSGEISAVLIGLFELNKMDGVFASSFQGNGHAYVCTISGDVITRTDSKNSTAKNNLLRLFKSATVTKYDTYDMVKENMQKGKKGHSEYILDGQRRLMHYEPLGISNWYVVSVTGYNYINQQVTEIMNNTILLTTCIILLFSILFAVYLFNYSKLRKAEAEVREADQRTQLMLNATPIGSILWRKDFTIMDCNEEILKMFGLKNTSDLSTNFFELSPKHQPNGALSKELALSYLSKSLEEGYSKFEWVHQSLTGEPIPSEVVLVRLSYKGEYVIAGYSRDLREQKSMMDEINKMLKNAILDEKCFRALTVHSKMAVVEWDNSIKKVRSYKSVEDLFKINLEEKKDYKDLVPFNMIHSEDIHIYGKILESVKLGESFNSIRLRLKTESGDYRWCNYSGITVRDDDGNIYKTIGFFEDIDEEVKREETLQQKSKIDALTRMYNKDAVRLLITEAMSNTSNGTEHAVICLDLDNFKKINDSFGHLYGDEVLIEISSKIKKMFRSSDILGRFGGDEFVLFMQDFPDIEFLKEKMTALNNSIRKTYKSGTVEHTVSASIGISLYPIHGTSYDELYRKADAASYIAKREGKDRYKFHEE